MAAEEGFIVMRYDIHRLAANGMLFGLGAALLGTGCGAQLYAEPVSAPPPAVYVQSAAQPVDDGSGDIAYDADPPYPDIESYPGVFYDGVTVYYVGGVWYRHDDHGWGYYRHEPRELERQRQDHDRDPRWARAREARPPSRPGVAERQPPDRGAPPPPAWPRHDEVQTPSPPRPGVPERQLQSPRALPVPVSPGPVHHDDAQPPPQPKRGHAPIRPVVRPAPSTPVPGPREPEHR